MDHLRDALHGLVYAVVGHDRREELGDLLIALAQDILMVEPDALLVIELGTRLGATAYIESLHQLVEGEKLLLGAGIPAQQSQEIDDGLGEITTLAETGRNLPRLGVCPLQGEYRETQAVAITLAKLSLSLGLEQQRQMGEAGHGVLPTESPVKQHMKRGGGQPLLTADDMGNLHQVVIDYIGQMIGGKLVRALEKHFVVENIGLHHHFSPDHIVYAHLLARVYLEAHGILPALGHQPLHLRGRKRKRIAHLHAGMGIILEVGCLGTFGFQLLGRIKGYIGLVLFQEKVNIFLVDITPLALAVRAMISPEGDTLVELDAQPLEGRDNIFLGSRHETRGVSILYAKHEIAPMLAGEQVIIQGRANSSDMQGTRRAGSETHPHFSFFHKVKTRILLKFCAKIHIFPQ